MRTGLLPRFAEKSWDRPGPPPPTILSPNPSKRAKRRIWAMSGPAGRPISPPNKRGTLSKLDKQEIRNLRYFLNFETDS